MNVGFDLVRNVVIDDPGDRFDIEAPSGHIGGYQCGDLAIPEPLQHLEAAFLIMVAMQGTRRITPSPQIPIQFDHGTAGVAEDDAGFPGVGVEELVDPVFFGVVVAADEFLIDLRVGCHLLNR